MLNASWRRKTGVLAAVVAAAVAATLAVVVGPAAAQTYPVKPVVIIVPSSAGGPADVTIRLMSERLSQALGQQVVVENVPGAGGTVGMGRVARAAPDGYTLLIHQTGFAIAPALYSRLTFDTAKDLVAVAMVNRSFSYWVGRKDLPANNFAELVAWMRGSGKPARVAHPGMGTFGHLQTMLLVRAMEPSASLIPYRGIAPAVNDLLGSHVDMAQVSAAVATPHIRAGNLKFYAHSSPTRVADFPDVPSYGEVVSKELERPLWHALFAPSGTPRAVLERINAAVQVTLGDAMLQKTFANSRVEPFPAEHRSLDASQAFVAEEIAFWGRAVRENDIKAD